MRSESFHGGRHAKLRSKNDCPFKVLEQFGKYAYEIELHGDYGVSVTFTVTDLSPYQEEKAILEDNHFFQPGGYDTKL